MLKTFALGAMLATGALLAAPASAAPLGFSGAPALAEAGSAPVETVQWRRYGPGPRYYGPGYGPGPYYRRGPSPGAVVGGAIAAGAIGALAAGALAAPRPVYGAPAPVYVDPTPDEIAYCSRRFRSYDPETGTYIANGGVVRACP